MTPRRKRHLTYATIGIFFFLGGVEYAVILPTVWLYLDETFHAPRYVLGFVLSAFSFSGLLASPLMGRWSDKTGNTKAIILFANLFEIAGSLMYFVGINQWFLVASRFVAGIGNGVASAIFADIARVTSKDDRTSVMSSFMAIRQFGLIIGPGFNLFLRQLNFDIFSLPVNKFSAPGLFMALMWTIHEVFVLFMYWNLPKLKLQEDLEDEQNRAGWRSSGAHLPVENSITAPLLEPGPASLGSIPESSHTTQHQPGLGPVHHNQVGAAITRPSIPESSHTAQQQLPDTPPSSIPNTSPSSTPKTPPRSIERQDTVEGNLTSSNEFLEVAEHLMSMTPGTQRRLVAASSNDPNFQRLLTEAAPPRSGYGSLDNSISFAEDHFPEEPPPEVKMSSVSTQELLSPPVPKSRPWRYYYDEFMREEVVAIVATVFVAFLNQCALETMTTPLTQKFLGWGEIENSILYCIAGVQILIVFLIIRVLSRKFTDTTLIVIGFSILVATVGFLTWYIPNATPLSEDPDAARKNLPGLVVGIFFDLLSLPFLIVCSASLYSKITREETQGFAQGIRRIFVGCGTILGPLWAGGLMKTSTEFYIMFGVMIAVNGIAMVLLLLSFNTLRSQEKVIDPSQLTTSQPPSSRSINSDSEERQSLLS